MIEKIKQEVQSEKMQKTGRITLIIVVVLVLGWLFSLMFGIKIE